MLHCAVMQARFLMAFGYYHSVKDGRTQRFPTISQSQGRRYTTWQQIVSGPADGEQPGCGCRRNSLYPFQPSACRREGSNGQRCKCASWGAGRGKQGGGVCAGERRWRRSSGIHSALHAGSGAVRLHRSGPSATAARPAAGSRRRASGACPTPDALVALCWASTEAAAPAGAWSLCTDPHRYLYAASAEERVHSLLATVGVTAAGVVAPRAAGGGGRQRSGSGGPPQ